MSIRISIYCFQPIDRWAVLAVTAKITTTKTIDNTPKTMETMFNRNAVFAFKFALSRSLPRIFSLAFTE